MRRRRNTGILVMLVLGLCALAMELLPRAVASAHRDRGDGIAWRSDLGEATAEAEATGKPLFLSFTADWCPPCQQMEEETWRDGRVRTLLNERFTPVKVDVDADPWSESQHGVMGIPTLIVFEGEEAADRAVGFHGPAAVLRFLEGRGAAPAVGGG